MMNRGTSCSLLRCALLASTLMLGACGERGVAPTAGLNGNPERGRLALTQYACQSCHRIPGITGSDVHVGPPLDGLAGRTHIARSLPNTPENLVRWIRDPRQVDPATAMPMMGVSQADAVDMSAYLLKKH